MKKEMTAVTFKDIATYEIGKRAVPEITRPDEVRVAVEAASICGTDVHLLNDPPGIYRNQRNRPGARVCGHSGICRRGSIRLKGGRQSGAGTKCCLRILSLLQDGSSQYV